jgi:ArsR family transcriptional regulator, arsenate/arsenite/antimonite-responsive transcriptional repressor
MNAKGKELESSRPLESPDHPQGVESPIPPACCTLEISGAEQTRLIAMFRALGNPVRFEIVKFLVAHPGCITGDIVTYLPIAQSTVSQHLKVLRDAGWIEGSISGAAVNYCLHVDNIAWFKSKVGEIF